MPCLASSWSPRDLRLESTVRMRYVGRGGVSGRRKITENIGIGVVTVNMCTVMSGHDRVAARPDGTRGAFSNHRLSTTAVLRSG